MPETIRELEINMSMRENVSSKAFRKKGHPRNAEEGQGWESTETSDTLNIFDNSESRTPLLIAQTFDARGNGDGKITCTITGEHQNRITDYTAILLERETTEMDEGKNMVVRRLTPLECERLQGYPDGWTDIGDWIDSDGKKHKGDADAPRYKALGNSICLPFWEWMAHRMVAVLRDEGVAQPTMASLFDGIGGFPLVYSRCGCSPIWASEIEEFGIAVTKRHFPEYTEGR